MKGEYKNPILDTKAVASRGGKVASRRPSDPRRKERKQWVRAKRRGTGYRPASYRSFTKRRQIDRKVEVRAAGKRARAARRITRRRG